MNVILLANISMVIGSFFGMMFIAHRRRIGFIIFILAEVSYAFIGYKTGNYGLIVIAVFYFIMNIYSWVQWGKHKLH